jgi:methylmalonyl-CoA decarboxylase
VARSAPGGYDGRMPLVETRVADRIGTLRLHRPEKRNALSADLLGELVAALEAFARDEVRVVVLRAAPDATVWSAGHDIRELPHPGRDPLGFADPLECALRAVRHHPAPVIAMVHGSVWGGATDLVLACDLAVGDPTASFAITPVNLGLPYNTSGILQFMARVPLHVAKEMFFTAEPIDAERARECGILNRVVPAAELEQATYALARVIAAKSPLAVSVVKEQLRLLSFSHPLSPETFERIQGLRRVVYDSADYAEGIVAFLEKRAPEFHGR